MKPHITKQFIWKVFLSYDKKLHMTELIGEMKWDLTPGEDQLRRIKYKKQKAPEKRNRQIISDRVKNKVVITNRETLWNEEKKAEKLKSPLDIILIHAC